MTISIAPCRPEHVPALGQICYDAFGDIQTRHGVERDFTSPDEAAMVIGMFASRPDFAGFVAKEGSELLGSNFLGFSDPVAGIGPITVRPATQSKGVGRLLMQAVLDEAARRDISQIRLLQEAINTTSLSLYTKLGFDWRESCALIRPAPAPIDDSRARPVTMADLGVIDEISTRHYHTSRVNEVAGFIKSGFPGFLLRGAGGRITGYYFPGMLGHGFAETDADLAALVTHSVRYAPPPFHKAIVPLSQNGLQRLLMAKGCRTLKLLNYMSFGPYRPPQGAWMPCIGM